MSATVFSKFYWSDWIADPGLRKTSLAARGLWMEMLCIMATAERRGYLMINGIEASSADLASIAGVPVEEVETLLAELERNRIFSRDRHGKITSRRIIRDEKRSKAGKKNGKLGGNPNLSNDNGKSPSLNPKPKAGLTTPLGPNGARPESSKPVANKPIASSSSPEPVDWDLLEAALRSAARWENEPHPGLRVVGPIVQLLDAGADLDKDVLPTIRAKAPTVRKRIGWAYFVDPIIEARNARLAIQAKVVPAEQTQAPIWENWTERQYQAAIIAVKRSGRWPETFGPVERIPEHLVDDDLRRILRRAA